MEANLHFVITTVDDAQFTQDINCPEDKIEAAAIQILGQYATVGMLKKDGGRYILLTASQIKFVEVEVPTVMIASPSDTQRVAAAAGSIKKITT